MINVNIYENSRGIKAFEITGHAKSGPYGYDLVCAGVSAVSFGATNALIKVGTIEPEIEQGAEGGYLSVGIPSDSASDKTIQTILKTMIISLETIEEEYSEFIQIKRK